MLVIRLVLSSLLAWSAVNGQCPQSFKLDTIDVDLVEATAVVFMGCLYSFEYVRHNYWANRTGDDHFRFADHETGLNTPAFAKGRIVTAVNRNNSDIDFCEYKGRVVVNYSWGNQQGVEHLSEAVFDGTESEFLKAWFPTAVTGR